MKPSQMAILFATLSVAWAGDGVVLKIRPERIAARSGDRLKVSATIENGLPTNVSLVLPGDGSDHGWRTPTVAWSFIPTRDVGRLHPADPVPSNARRCGNINAIEENEVFILKSGAKRKIDSWPLPQAAYPPGEYRAVLYYVNDPAKVPGGPLVLGRTSESVKKAIDASTPVKLVSNEIFVTVTR